uniref:Uncharacterized protein n=1 Tax=viral metagenome TaxID=1070528 RepID=A0A6C0B714_9ZZZZ
MHYRELPDEKYIYYECLTNKDGFVFIVNENHIDQTFFTTSKIIRVSKSIPQCFHGLILRYYYSPI